MTHVRGEITVRIRDLVKALSRKQTSKPRLPKTALLNDELGSRLMSSPYASILASAPRECKVLKKMFPANMLLSFGLAIRPSSKDSPLKVAVPEVGQTHLPGTKYLVKLKKSILTESAKTANYKSIFRGSCDVYDTNMVERVQHELETYARDQLNPKWMVSLDPSPLSRRKWVSPVPLQCILILRDPSSSLPFCELDHTVDSESSSTTVPCYDVRHIWQQQVDSLIDPTNTSEHVAVGIPKSRATVEFAVALWRCRQYLE